MSRLAKKPVVILQGVTVERNERTVRVTGPKGTLDVPILLNVEVAVEGNEARVTTNVDDGQSRANCGTTWSLLANATKGVVDGFSKVLQMEGVGYRVSIEGVDLVLNVGYSHTVRFPIPAGTKISVEKNIITVSGVDKDLVGRTAAEIRAFRPPEPYKGKGIRYQGEVIKIKAGKKAATGASA